MVVDGKSKDGTVAIAKEFENQIDQFASEPDKGISNGMNKGVQMAGDIVGILNSDDFYMDDQVLQKVVKHLKTRQLRVYADLVYVDAENAIRCTYVEIWDL